MKKTIDKQEKEGYNGLKVVLGNICYPKSEALIIPANAKGNMSRHIPARIVKDGLTGISKEAEAFVTKNKVEVGQCFSTGSGRLSRRGLKKIYHVVIKRLQSDFTSIHIVNDGLKSALDLVIKDGMASVAICGLGIRDGNLDKRTIARIIVDNCKKYSDKIEIKIIDDNEEFVKEVKNLVKE